jgi:uncharacterized protein YecE (DUF72 family)
MGDIRVGIGGWVYKPWRGLFYPKGLPQAQELEHASRRLTSIEINGTFYGAQKPASFRRWHAETPDTFVFSVKGPRFATHRSNLAESKPTIERFFGTGVLELAEKLGPIFWQFPATTKFDAANFATFLDLLPQRIDGRTIRHAVEIRHPSFATPAAVALFRQRGVALVFVDGDGYLPFRDVTADFVYARLRNTIATEPTGYPPAALDTWAKRFRCWAEGGEPADVERVDPAPAPGRSRDCFVYFISGAKERAPGAAEAMIKRLAAKSA